MKTLKKGCIGYDVKVLQRMLHLIDDGVFGPITEETVMMFQHEHGLTVDGIVGPKTWDALAPAATLPKSRRKITEIIVHCTATAIGKDFTVQDIIRWHKARGFKTIGYHYVIYLDGSVHEGRDVNLVGAHCTGHNAHSIGVCYVGGCAKDGLTPMDTRTPEQKESLRKLVAALQKLYPGATVHGHYEFAAKACPSFKIKDL